ncbi:ABC transporter permease [Caldifermentibacillus hisashii]|uniref:ABC transporter permease n=1 Tax=Caldifermentibacillus hisashii TaxID=996558 RepID=UPI0022B9B219|nr:ABC transporter permease [Caldifermentibacillus hisashii]
MLKNFNLIVGGTIVTLLLAIFIISFFYLPNNVNDMNIAKRLLAPNKEYLLGTDNFGRDILSRIMQGSQTAFIVGTCSVLIGLTGGIIIGSIAGYFGGWIDEVFMRFIDALLAFPGILLALMLVTIFKPSLTVTVIAIGIMSIPSFARIIRSGFLKFKQANFVKAARNFGASHLRIIFLYILPNNIAPIIVTASLSFSTAILIEAALSYLGLGVQPPDPSWGSMLKDAQGYAQKAPWYTVAPGIMLTLTVLGFNLLGDGLRDLHDIKK